MSKEYDIDNAISNAIIYEIDSFVTPLSMLWGQLNSDCNNESFYLAKPLYSDHVQRTWVSTILLNSIEQKNRCQINLLFMNPHTHGCCGSACVSDNKIVNPKFLSLWSSIMEPGSQHYLIPFHI